VGRLWRSVTGIGGCGVVADDAEGENVPPLVGAATEAVIRAHATNLAATTAARDESLTRWLEAFETEHAGVLQRALTETLAHPQCPAVLRDILGPITNPVHQTQILLGFLSISSLVSGFVTAAIAPEVQAVANFAWNLNPDVPLTPADMALAVLRGVKTQDEGINEAALSGTNVDRFNTLVLNTGEPPGLEMLMEALRRKFIDEGRFEKGVKESRIRNEWTDTLLALRHAPIPVGTATAAAIQGYLTLAEFAHRLDVAGIDPVEAQLLYDTAGRPPGTFELAELVNRGEMSVADLEQAVRESDIKNKYIPALVLLRRKIPPMRSIVAAIHQGVLTAEQGIEKLMNLGYDAADAAMFAKEGTALKHTTTKHLAQGEIVRLYTERLIARPAAESMLENIGYDATESTWILDLADHARHAHAQATAVSRVHARYVAFHIDRLTASTAIDKLGIDTAGRDDLLGTWDDERAANAPQLTLANLHGLAERGIITQAQFRDRLLQLGHPAADIPLLWVLSWPVSKTAPRWTL
jgi:hypothetical protein